MNKLDEYSDSIDEKKEKKAEKPKSSKKRKADAAVVVERDNREE